MKVAELIELLKQLPADANVYAERDAGIEAVKPESVVLWVNSHFSPYLDHDDDTPMVIL